MTRTDTSRPKITVPPGACDTHLHFYDDSYPASPKAWLFPPNHLPEDYRAVQDRLGLERMIVVQPVTYGFDNRCILDAIARIGDSARAVVTVPTDISDADLAALWDKGARGLRYHQMAGSMTEWSDLPVMAARIKGTGWHLQVQLDGLELPDRESLIADLPCTVVIDHMGRYSECIALDHPAHQALLRLAAQPNGWVKLSGASPISKAGKPDYADVAPLARALIAQGTDRLLWGSDWPHPTETDDTMPDDARIIDLLADWGLSEAQREAVLVTNPARLYGF